jgi:hypothetical protein
MKAAAAQRTILIIETPEHPKMGRYLLAAFVGSAAWAKIALRSAVSV